MAARAPASALQSSGRGHATSRPTSTTSRWPRPPRARLARDLQRRPAPGAAHGSPGARDPHRRRVGSGPMRAIGAPRSRPPAAGAGTNPMLLPGHIAPNANLLQERVPFAGLRRRKIAQKMAQSKATPPRTSTFVEECDVTQLKALARPPTRRPPQAVRRQAQLPALHPEGHRRRPSRSTRCPQRGARRGRPTSSSIP
jgi:pyruvate/2-oxoglutarate dehydrogenase complex dihydrolipoamide acyltransferase (E2) component